MTPLARLVIDPDFRIGAPDSRLFGTFVEHLGRCVYGGIHEPGHPAADQEGFRGDVTDLVREMGPTIVRYPGGNFVSGYRWEDGIGPVQDRPCRLDPAWRTIEPNTVGVDEFLGWAARTGLEPMMAVNLGTRGVQSAADLVEYCNHPQGTYWSDLRVRHGAHAPHGIRVWCLGNEMDGPWQIGHKTAEEYGRLARETAKAMRLVDPSLELVACGSSNGRMPTFGTWEATVLEHTYDVVDYVSLHTYYEETEQDRASFLASAVDMDHCIEAVVATAEHVRARLRSAKKIRLSFDEWNVWNISRFHAERDREPDREWRRAPRLIEDTYTVTDAVVVGSMLISLLNHADSVGIACQAQLVNVIAPIRCEPGGPAWRQTIFHPFAHAARYGRGTVLRTEPRAPRIETAKYGDVDALAAAVCHDEDTGELTVFAVNRDQHAALVLEATLRGFPAEYTLAEHLVLTDTDPDAVNTMDQPERVVPCTQEGAEVAHGQLHASLAPLSWNVLRLRTVA
jgi:alpha-L-arabinofuranosidase